MSLHQQQKSNKNDLSPTGLFVMTEKKSPRIKPLIATLAFNDAVARVVVQLESMEVDASPVP